MDRKRPLTEAFGTTAQGELSQPSSNLNEQTQNKRRKANDSSWTSVAWQTSTRLGQAALGAVVYSCAVGIAAYNVLKGRERQDALQESEAERESPPPPTYEETFEEFRKDARSLPPSKKQFVRRSRRPAIRRLPVSSTFTPPKQAQDVDALSDVNVEELNDGDASFASLNSTLQSLIHQGKKALTAAPDDDYLFTFEPDPDSAAVQSRLFPSDTSMRAAAQALERVSEPSKTPWWE